MKKLDVNKVLKCEVWKPPDKYPLTKLKSNSWFDINEYKQVNGKDVECETKVLRCKQFRINPTIKQRDMLLVWMKIYKMVYNKTVLYLRTNKLLSKQKLRDIMTEIIMNNTYINDLFIKFKMPKHTFDNVVFDVHKAFKSAIANFKAKILNILD